MVHCVFTVALANINRFFLQFCIVLIVNKILKYNHNKIAHINLCVRTLLGKIMGKLHFGCDPGKRGSI